MSHEDEKALLEESRARLAKSRIDPTSHIQNLTDIEGLFDEYQEMKSEHGKVEGTLETVNGEAVDGTREIFQVLRGKDGNICYIGNASHPCGEGSEDPECGG